MICWHFCWHSRLCLKLHDIYSHRGTYGDKHETHGFDRSIFIKFDFDHWASIRIILVSLIMPGIFQLLIGGHTGFGFLTAAVSRFLLSSLATVACEFPFPLCLPLTSSPVGSLFLWRRLSLSSPVGSLFLWLHPSSSSSVRSLLLGRRLSLSAPVGSLFLLRLPSLSSPVGSLFPWRYPSQGHLLGTCSFDIIHI